jgi:hypothetical protein
VENEQNEGKGKHKLRALLDQQRLEDETHIYVNRQLQWN